MHCVRTPPSQSAGGKDQAAKKPRDAFASIPERAILRGVCGTHNLILNKFPLIREHTVLVTKQFVPQVRCLSQCVCAGWRDVCGSCKHALAGGDS